MSSVLVVGASGILAPAASALMARGAAVTGLSRRGHAPAGVDALHLDARDLSALDAGLSAERWSEAIVYEPAVSAQTLRRIAAAVDGRLVLVRTSASADPAHGDDPAREPDVLVLGWADDGASTRWHTPQEVSDAALEVLADGAPRILGAVRPWERRP
ncbi:hypothetical protein [Microbacterium sp. 1.5R]|uniref:hypothetical protein n=1 Tax=Microbacterium sp. 1.5R TaxID=1916917 RepID=UPI0011A8AD64|nr:hypothetical protein [Microbacterium sp. 1.5R]